MADYKANSPYFSTKQTTWYLQPMQPRYISEDKSDMFVVVNSETENRPTILSESLYDTPAYWWVITICNIELVRDSTRDLLAGMTIRMPTPERLHKLLG